ncbi:T9SS type A sorting domain-containing protein [Owenweeksia hongkongensis]|uniref:T9SS type A sorting domain-containing protein n=1 Tax=Owenweeksia hongkongensis TaxID=253245 RepID=UPI003A917AE0
MKKITILCALLATAFGAKSQFDTTGIGSWNSLNNSYETWLQGAFDANRDPNDATDFGWGNYDMSTHIIGGDSIYIIKTMAGDFKAISIDQISGGVYTITYSNLDFSNKVTKTLDRSSYSTKNYFFYSLDNEVEKDLEPATADWDIVFTKFLTFFPGFGAYPVAGVLHNDGVKVSEVEFMTNGSFSVTDTVAFPLSENISTIGYEWKDAFAGIVYDTLGYVVKDQMGNINDLQFTGYGGSATGKMVFEVNGVADSVILGSGNDAQVYYSLENMAEVKTNTDHDWDIALYAQSSFSNIPVRINDSRGVELYVYPSSDITFWNTVGLEEERTVNVLSVYPNPASDFINVALQADMPNSVMVNIIDAAGRVVQSQNINTTQGISESRISTAHLSAGIYTVQLSGEGFVASSRVAVRP